MKKEMADTPLELSYVFTVEDLRRLLEKRDGPCVSIYFPAHVRPTESRADSILYRNLVREVEKILQRDTSPSLTRGFVSQLTGLDQPEFWERGSAGVAVFLSSDLFACYRLPVEFRTLEVVGVSFHTKPLLRYLQEGLSYNVLALSLHRVSLYDIWGSRVQEIPINGVSRSVEAALGREPATAYRGEHPRGDDRIHHAQGDGGDDGKTPLEKFFREVAKGIKKKGLNDTRKPLILATHKQYASLFRKVAQLPNLLEEGISADAGKLSVEEIQEQSSEILRPEIERRIDRARKDFALASSRGQGSDRLADVARAVAEGRVKQLLVESGRRIWGLIDTHTGELIPGEPEKNAYDVDLLDELAELSLTRGGEVMVLTREQMPSRTGVAATFRF